MFGNFSKMFGGLFGGGFGGLLVQQLVIPILNGSVPAIQNTATTITSTLVSAAAGALLTYLMPKNVQKIDQNIMNPGSRLR